MHWKAVPLLLVLAACGKKESKAEMIALRVERIANLRTIANMLIVTDPFPMKDGALDLYALVKKGDLPRDLLQKGGVPTNAEIDGGDYTRFPYHRYQGEGKPVFRTRPVALLWDKEPDAEGMFVVAFNDGSARALDRAELTVALGK